MRETNAEKEFAYEFPTAAGIRYRVAIGILGVLVLAGLVAWINQLIFGLGETGMKNSVNWGIYMTNFVFFIGISHAGTLISAVLRLLNAEWRRPITRVAEAITVFALLLGGFQLVLDSGRPLRLVNVFVLGRLQSPLLWDLASVSVYFASACFYLLLPLIPDLGALRNQPGLTQLQKKTYTALSSGWNNSSRQQQRLKRVIGIMAILIIPIMVTVHSVVSWIFGLTVRYMWHSSIFGPYFVVGAIFSGVAAVVLSVAVMRRTMRLEAHLTALHFNKLGALLLVMACLWFYFTLAEYLTTGYGGMTAELAVLKMKLSGEFALAFWAMILCMASAFVLLLLRKKSVIGMTTAASALIVVGMWLERFTIIVPTLTKPLEEGYNFGLYRPTLTEWVISSGSLAGFALLLIVFARFFPIISLWEIQEAKDPTRESNIGCTAPLISGAGELVETNV